MFNMSCDVSGELDVLAGLERFSALVANVSPGEELQNRVGEVVL